MKEMKKDLLDIKIYDTREQLGYDAARDAATYINNLLEKKNEINILFAAAPSQNEFLSELRSHPIEWSRINAFHMDEYIGLKKNDAQRFGNYLKRQVFEKIDLKSVHYLFDENVCPEDVCTHYSEMLDKYPIDIVFMGIGENGHIAFNDPSVADFNDPKSVKVVELDTECRQQQVNEGLFANLDLVPKYAITVTIPQLLKAELMFCMVPASNKAEAVYRTLNDDISEKCPATILRSKDKAILYLDKESASLLD